MNLITPRVALSGFGLFALLLISTSVLGDWSQVRPGVTASETQNLIRIESRINQVEQRLYSMEAQLRSLDQQVRLSSPAANATTRDTEMIVLRSEVDALRQRYEEIACGLLRLDERTLPPAAREARRKSANDPAELCRVNSEVPLRLAVRP